MISIASAAPALNPAWLNGSEASAADLRALALANYGHFTVMQVRDRAVQGWSFHQQRLQDATTELFGSELDFARMRFEMRQAVADCADASMRITVFSRQFDYRDAGKTCTPDVLITLSPASTVAKPAMRVKTFPFVRPLPQIKHVGTFPLFHYRRQALAAGFDDALFMDAQDQVGEGSIWNIGFWDGSQFIWPQAAALRGSTEWLVQQGLSQRGLGQQTRPVARGELQAFRAAFATNASGLQVISSIDGVSYAQDTALWELLQQALQRQPWEPL